MKYVNLGAAVVLAVVSVAGASIAQTSTTQTTTTRTVTLTPEQRTTFREYVVREPRTSVTVDNVEVGPGIVLPPAVQFYTVPQITNYQYGYVNNRYVVVDPSTRRVIEVIQ